MVFVGNVAVTKSAVLFLYLVSGMLAVPLIAFALWFWPVWRREEHEGLEATSSLGASLLLGAADTSGPVAGHRVGATLSGRHGVNS